MSLEFRHVRYAGDLEHERVVLKARRRLNLGDYLVADTTYYEDGSVSNQLRHVYWFPNYIVAQDDLVVLYTKKGKEFFRMSGEGPRSHFLYWGLDRSIWNQDADGAVVIEIRDWFASPVRRRNLSEEVIDELSDLRAGGLARS